MECLTPMSLSLIDLGSRRIGSMKKDVTQLTNLWAGGTGMGGLWIFQSLTIGVQCGILDLAIYVLSFK
jgi:hypothetical protein